MAIHGGVVGTTIGITHAVRLGALWTGNERGKLRIIRSRRRQRAQHHGAANDHFPSRDIRLPSPGPIQRC